MGTMTKADLIATFADRAGLTKADAGKALTVLTEVIQERTAAGDTVKIAGFGNFKVKVRAPRLGRNPATGAEIQIAESRVLSFKPSKKADAA